MKAYLRFKYLEVLDHGRSLEPNVMTRYIFLKDFYKWTFIINFLFVSIVNFIRS